jgi:hypothetical protein
MGPIQYGPKYVLWGFLLVIYADTKVVGKLSKLWLGYACRMRDLLVLG